MNMEGRKPDLHMIDGRAMTLVEIADMMGLSYRGLVNRRFRLGQCSYQLVVDMWRRNEIGGHGDRQQRHLVHGRWMTVAQAAEELGTTPHAIRDVRYRASRDGHPMTLEEVYDFYANGLKRPRGFQARYHRVLGHLMTVAEAAQKYKTTEGNLRKYMSYHHSTLETAVRRLEERRAKEAARQAEKEILSILGYGVDDRKEVQEARL